MSNLKQYSPRSAGTLSFLRKRSATLVTLLLLLNALVVAYAAYRSLFCLGDVTVPEGAVVYSVEGVLRSGWPLYRDYTVPPYSTTPYTPLFYLLSAALAWGTSKSVYAIYIVCRLLTLASTVGAAFFVQRIALLLRAEIYPLRHLVFLLPFTILTLVAWGFAARPDMLGVMLALAGIYVFLRAPDALRNSCASAAILVLSWGCKPSFVAAPVAIFLALLWEKQWRRAGIFAMMYGCIAAGLAGGAQWLSHGWFFANIVTANVTKLITDQVWGLSVYGYFHLAPFIVFTALLGCFIYRRELIKAPRLRCVMLYLLATMALNMAACMKDGAYINYMLEPLFAAAIMAALGVDWLMRRRAKAIAAPWLLLASLAFSYHSYWYYDGALANALGADINEENAAIQAVLHKMDGLKGDVLTSRSALAVRSAKPVLATDLFNARYLEQEGKLSTAALAQRIRRRELAAIVAPQGCQPSAKECDYWPPGIRQAILEQYEPGELLYGEVFWYPKSTARENK